MDVIIFLLAVCVCQGVGIRPQQPAEQTPALPLLKFARHVVERYRANAIPWRHGGMGPWYHGAMVPDGTMIWYHGAMDHATLASWFCDTFVPWPDGTMPWSHVNGTMDPRYHGTLVP